MISSYQKKILTKLCEPYVCIKKYIDNKSYKISICTGPTLIQNISPKIFNFWVENKIIKADPHTDYYHITKLGQILTCLNYKELIKDLGAIQEETLRIIVCKSFDSSDAWKHIKSVQRKKSCRCCWNHLVKVNKKSISYLIKHGILAISGKDESYNNSNYNAWSLIKTNMAQESLSSTNNIHLKERKNLAKINMTWEQWIKLPHLQQEYLMREKDDDPKEWKKIKTQIEARIEEEE